MLLEACLRAVVGQPRLVGSRTSNLQQVWQYLCVYVYVCVCVLAWVLTHVCAGASSCVCVRVYACSACALPACVSLLP